MTRRSAACASSSRVRSSPGPCTGMMLADLGADVIKVESPEGDPYRSYQRGQFSPHFQAYNRNKRSIALDLAPRRPRAVRAARARGGRLHPELPPGHSRAARRRRRALARRSIRGSCTVRSAVSASSGPYAERPSYDSVAQALSGFLSVVVDPERPRFMGPALADAITGIYAAYGVLGALFERARTGHGRLVEVSMLEAMAHFAVEPFAALLRARRGAALERPAAPRAGVHPAHGGRRSDRHPPLVAREVLAGPDDGARRAGARRGRALRERRLARIEHYDALGAALDALFARRPLADWVERLGA